MRIYSLKEIKTPRLILRPVAFGDEIPLNKAIHNSLEVLQRWQPWAQDPSMETTKNFIQWGVLSWGAGGIAEFPMVVIHKDDQRIIGASGYNDRTDLSQGLYEIGYWCDVDYQGQGYVTEYVNALTRYALIVLGAKTVMIRMEVDNLKSKRVAERLNFTNEGKKPSVIKKEAIDYLFTCSNPSSLPPLEVAWIHREK
jgi:RimJ/RimL family protein N-acetyltransferase